MAVCCCSVRVCVFFLFIGLRGYVDIKCNVLFVILDMLCRLMCVCYVG